MKQKLFTLFMLLVAVTTGAWAQDESKATWDFESSADGLTIENNSNASTAQAAYSSTGSSWTNASGSGCLYANLGSTKGASSVITTNSSYDNISKISLKLGTSDRGKTEFALQICPTADFSSNVTNVQAQATVNSSDFTGGSISKNTTMCDVSYTIETPVSGYVRLIVAQASGSNNKKMIVDDLEITYTEEEVGTKYAVSYAAGEGSGTMTGAEYAEGRTIYLPSSTFTAPEGKAFYGWLCSIDNQIYAAGASYVMTAAATTFTAQYVRVANKIIYSLVDGIGSAESAAGSPTVNDELLSLPNSGDRIKLTAVTGEQFQNGDAVTFSGTVGNTTRDYGVKYGTTTSINGGSLYVAGTTDPLVVTGTLTLSSSVNDIYIGRYGGTTTNMTSFVITRQLAVLSESFGGVKINGTVATENTDYTIDGTTITLSDSYTSAPTVALINTITFADNTTSDTPVNVEMTLSGENYTGTATIGDVTYTVIAPANSAAELNASEDALTVTSVKVGVGTATFTLTGNNLTGETVTLAFASTVEGLSVSPASIEISEGSVNQEVTVSYMSASDVEQASVNLTITTDGVDAISIPVTYSSTAGVTTLTDVTEATTWDWSATGLSANTASLDANNIVVLSNIDGWASTFNAAAIAGKGQYLYYKDNSCFQGSILKFHTTVPGVVTVIYSNTGNRNDSPENYRYLYINDVKADDAGSISASTKNTVSNYAVEAGDVELKGIQGENTENMLRIYKVVFTPTITLDDTSNGNAAKISANAGKTVNVTVSRTLSPDYYNTLYLPFAMSAEQMTTAFGDGAQVATFTGEIKNETSFQFANVTAMEAYTGYLVKPAATVNGFTVEGATIESTVPSVETDWAMIGTLDNFANSTENGDIYYFTTSGTVKKLSATGNIKGLRAFMCDNTTASNILNNVVSNAGLTFGGPSNEPARADEFVFYISIDGDDDVTAINAIDGVPVLDANAPIYNLAGQRVGQSYKGVVIQNGKKFVIK